MTHLDILTMFKHRARNTQCRQSRPAWKIFGLQHLFFTILLTLAFIAPAHALCVQGDCVDGNGTMLWPDGTRYTGQFKSSARHGRGILTRPDGTQYEGDYQNDLKNGEGTLSFADGKTYKGFFVDGLPEGLGTFTFSKDSQFQGEYKAGKKHGLGRRTYADGTVYEGGFQDDRRHGFGAMFFPDGRVYEGEFANDIPEGAGIFTVSGAIKYKGEYRQGKKHGQGLYIYADGTMYEGEFRNDNRNGKGKSLFVDGTVYEGEYRDDKKHGNGFMTSLDGKMYKGQFENDLPNGFGILLYPDGAKYEGEFKDGKKNGKGELIYAEGTRQSALWKDSKIVKDLGITDPEDVPVSLTGGKNNTDVPGRFPQASLRLLTQEDLASLKKIDLDIMRNEIFARHSYIFRTEEMQNYFSSQPWYKAEQDNVDAQLSTVEIENVKRLLAYEQTPTTPTKTPTQATNQPPKKNWLRVIKNANIRSAPQDNASILLVVKKGFFLKVLEQQGEWLRVKGSDKTEGWVHSALVQETGSPAAQPADDNNAPTIKAQYVTVKGEDVNMRSQPDMQGKVLRRAVENFPLRVVKQSGAWVLGADFLGREGWIHASLLSDELSSVIVKAENAIIRQEPDKSAAHQASVVQGEIVNLVSVADDWAKIRYQGKTGWIHKDLVWPIP